MRCSKCGHENPEGMKYCMYCGSQLVQADSSLLYQTALGYTGSASAAEKISAENKDMHTLSLACIAWIREQEPALFDQLQDGDDSRTMETLEDFSQLRQLDYEERICLLLRTEDKENIEDIAKLLNLTSSQVRYYLQSAWKKNHPDLSSKQRKAEEKEKIDDENYRPAGPSFRKMKPIIWKSILAAMVVFICAAFFIVKQFAKQEYETGIALMEKGNNDEAIRHLTNAASYGGARDAEEKLGRAYYENDQYDQALTIFKKLKPEEAKEDLILTYQAMGNAYIDEEKYKEAGQCFAEQYALDDDKVTWLRQQACENEGSYKDENGNVYNVYGLPEELNYEDAKVKITYDKDQKITKITYRRKDDTFTIPDLDADAEMDVSLYRNSRYHTILKTLNDNGDIEKLQDIDTDSKTTLYRTYTYDDDGKIKEMREKGAGSTAVYEYEYEDSLLKEITGPKNKKTTFTYDENDRVKEMDTPEQDETYLYNEDDTLKEKTITQGRKKQTFTYTYTAGSPFSVIVSASGKDIGYGWYIRNNGWLTIYDENYYNNNTGIAKESNNENN